MTIERTYNETYIKNLTELFNGLKNSIVDIDLNDGCDSIEEEELINVLNNFVITEDEGEKRYTFLGDVIGFKLHSREE